MEYFFVAIGGAVGSLTRFSLGKMISSRFNNNFPIGTFIINITGAFFLGVVSSFTLNKNIYLLLADGFLGAYTTFSTFMYEGFSLFKNNETLNAFIYILSSLVIGILGFFIGVKVCLIFISII